MAPPTAQKAMKSTMIRLSSSTCQQLRRTSRVRIAAADGRGIVRSYSKFSTEASPLVKVAPEDHSSVIAPAVARGASLATRKKPLNGYLNKVSGCEA